MGDSGGLGGLFIPGSILGTLILYFWLFIITSGTGCDRWECFVFPLLFFMVTGFLYKLMFILIMKIGYLAFGLIKRISLVVCDLF